DKEKHDLSGEAAYKAAIQEGYFDLIELSYGYHTPLAMQIEQNLTASKHYDLVARIPIHDSYGDGYYWLWSKHATSPSCTQPQPAPGKLSLAGLAYGPSHTGADPNHGVFLSSEEIEA